VRPALASFNGRVYLAWKGDGNTNLNVMVSTDGGRTFRAQAHLAERSRFRSSSWSVCSTARTGPSSSTIRLLIVASRRFSR